MQLQLTRTTFVQPTPNTLAVAAMFGLGIDDTRTHTIIPPITLDLHHGVYFVTGASGSGKSSLLQLIAQQRPDALRFDDLPPLPDGALVDCFPSLQLPDVLRILSLAGLGDAFVMLRRPCELSDGQRYRLRLAQVMALVEARLPIGDCQLPIEDPPTLARPSQSAIGNPQSAIPLILADEFGATLDRITAAVLARNVRKWVTRQQNTSGGVVFIAATTHDDLLEPFDPDVLIEKHLDGGIDIVPRPEARAL